MSHVAQRSQRSLRAGFSFIEITIVIIIIGILMAVLLPGLQTAIGSAKTTTTKAALRKLSTKIEQYKADTGKYPDTLYDLQYKPDDEKASKRWRGPYIENERELEDGWSDELVYERTPDGAHPYELYSWGGDEGNPEEKHISVWDE